MDKNIIEKGVDSLINDKKNDYVLLNSMKEKFAEDIVKNGFKQAQNVKLQKLSSLDKIKDFFKKLVNTI